MSIFLAAAGHPAGPLRSTGAEIKTESADPNLRPWEVATIKKPLTSLFLSLLRPWVVLIKTDVNFSGTAAAHPPDQLLQHWNRDKDRAGESQTSAPGKLPQLKILLFSLFFAASASRARRLKK